MKLIERIAYISFWINIFFVIFIYIGMPILLINVPNFFETLTANGGRNPLNISISILSLAVAFLWGYCIWFLFKYDRYSKSIFLLLFLNMIYAPIYYYRVKIKKRPLRNKINKPIKVVETEDKSISNNEFIKLTRENVIRVLKLWSSKEEQIEYQKSDSKINVSNELFDQWNDFYIADSEATSEAFSTSELELLNEFDKLLNKVKYDESRPTIAEYINTCEWKELNELAKKILSEIE